ncbi:MAG: hypothetical protein VYE15_07115, partial [Myxococcota bacterium]|nr:hypothetical protein [Myxococcota bacterium]
MTTLRALTTALLLLAITALCACADDTPDAAPATPTEYALELTVTNGISEDGLPGIEACTESPVGTTLFCETTDDNGLIALTLTDLEAGPLLTRLSGDDYLNTLAHGRLGEDVFASWDQEMADTGKVALGSIIVGELLLTAAVAPLGV